MKGTLCLKISHKGKYFLSPLGFLFVCRLLVSICCEGVIKIDSTNEAQAEQFYVDTLLIPLKI